MYRHIAAAIVSIPAIAGFSGGAQADFTVCNQTFDLVSVAIGYHDGDEWVSEGWWNLDYDECAQVISGDLSNTYYYVRGESHDGVTYWTDDYNFCYIDEVFTIYGDENCSDRGYKSGGFMEIDTGNKLDYTLDLTD